jgi:hypothetical protein
MTPTFSGSSRKLSIAPYGAKTWMSCSLVTELSRLPIQSERVGVCICCEPSFLVGECARPCWFGAARYGFTRAGAGSGSGAGKCTDGRPPSFGSLRAGAYWYSDTYGDASISPAPARLWSERAAASSRMPTEMARGRAGAGGASPPPYPPPPGVR